MTRGYQLDASAKDATRVPTSLRWNWSARAPGKPLIRSASRNCRPGRRRLGRTGAGAAASAGIDRGAGVAPALSGNGAAEAAAVGEESRQRQQQARAAVESVNGAEQRLESARRYAMQLLTEAGHARNQTLHAEESLAALSRMRNGWLGYLRRQLELPLGSERGQVSLSSSRSPISSSVWRPI